MQRLLPSGIVALSILAVTLAPGCKADQGDADPQAAKQADPKPDDEAGVAAPVDEAGAEAGVAAPVDEAGAAAEAGVAAPVEEAEAGDEAPVDEAGAQAPVAEENPVPALFEQAKNLETEDGAAKQALNDAIAAGGSKIDAAKAANERGETLMAKGEGERAEAFFRWAADTHKLYSEPVYNLATVAAYAGDLDIAKEHLQELQKRGNKKLMKKVGVDPAFAPLHDDPEVRKIYEQ